MNLCPPEEPAPLPADIRDGLALHFTGPVLHLLTSAAVEALHELAEESCDPEAAREEFLHKARAFCGVLRLKTGGLAAALRFHSRR